MLGMQSWGRKAGGRARSVESLRDFSAWGGGSRAVGASPAVGRGFSTVGHQPKFVGC